MRKGSNINIVCIGAIIILALILGTVFIIDRFFSNKPECYITTQSSCMLGYDQVELYYYSTIPFYQCCQKPHYMLQGIDPDLLNYCYDYKLNIIDKNVTSLFKW